MIDPVEGPCGAGSADPLTTIIREHPNGCLVTLRSQIRVRSGRNDVGDG